MTQKQLSIPVPNHPEVFVLNSQVVTTSLDVADFFGKQHKDVLRKIQNLEQKQPKWHRRNFTPMQENVDTANGGTISRTYYVMTRAGFSLVVLGFTGEKALAFQIAYVNRFEEMEAALRGDNRPLAIDTPSTVADRKPISNLVSIWVGCAPITFKEAWGMVHARFGIKSVEELSVSQIQTVVGWIQERIDAACTAVQPREFDLILEQLRDSRSASNAELRSAFRDYEDAGGKDAIGGWDIIYNMRKLYESVFNLAISTPLALDSLNRMEAELYRTAAVRLKMQKLIA